MTVWTLHNTLFPDEVEVRIKTFRARVDIRAFDAPFTVDSAASVPDDQKLRNSQHWILGQESYLVLLWGNHALKLNLTLVNAL